MPNVETPDGKVIEFPDSMSPKEINDVLNKQYPPPKQDGLVTKLAKAVDPVTKYGLPILGATLGGVAALPLNVGAPGVAEAAGVGAGTLIGQQAANYIGQMAGRRGGFNAQELLTRELPEASINAVSGPLINKALPYVAKFGQKVYGNAINTPITNKWTKLFPGQEGTARELAVKKGYDAGIYPTNFGIKTAAQNESQLKTAVDEIVDQGTASGDVVDRYALIRKGLANARNKSRVADPEASKVIDKLQRRVEAIGNPKEMTTRDLLDLKRQLYAETSWKGQDLSTFTEKQFGEVSKKGLAHEAMMQLEERYPALRFLNKEESAYINLKEALERTVAKHEQKIEPSTKGIWLALSHLPAAIAEETINHPIVKARLAFALKNAAARKGIISKPIVYGATAAAEDKL